MRPRLNGRLRPKIIAACVAILAFAFLLSLRPEWVERFYAGGPGPFLTWSLSTLTGWIPGSLAELLAAALAIAGGVAAYRGIGAARRGERSWRSVLGGGALNVTTVALVLLASFYVVWGLNYYRPDLATRLGWSEPAASTNADAADELERWAARLVEATNDAYVAAHGKVQAGHTDAPIPLERIDASIESGYGRIATELDDPRWAARRGRAKPLRISPILSRLNIAGIYLPWTSEASFNGMLPAAGLPHTIAHEKAHQRGLASEDEASFVGFLAAIRADEPYVRYSGLLYGQRRLLSELFRIDEERVAALVAGRHPGVQDDVDEIRVFWNRFRGPLRATGQKLNDTYLKLHGVEEGIASYGLSTRLILQWLDRGGGRLGGEGKGTSESDPGRL
jgi:hypothetical protein